MTTCVVCKSGTVSLGETTITLNRGQTTVVVKGVPADVCDNCGEPYLSEAVSERLYAVAEAAAQSGAELEIRRFAA